MNTALDLGSGKMLGERGNDLLCEPPRVSGGLRSPKQNIVTVLGPPH